MCSEYYEQYWKYSFNTSVIQTVFNTFLSMLDTRFHGMIKVARLLPIVAIKLFQFQFYQLNSKVIGNSGQKEKLTELLGDCSSVLIHFLISIISGEAVLPEEYGGTNGTIDEHRYVKYFRTHCQLWILKRSQFATIDYCKGVSGKRRLISRETGWWSSPNTGINSAQTGLLIELDNC